ncbi:hypothetical protein [Hydrogenoanaerobacterium sp.]|uniref:hypothetical protein n=1 Tax=Hydrogenoanaerobacterium sp. TaxID=2953763 RepID=UPI0028995872|nr:hypothetical protein [Hydrogenoanaerobacterium sp.]
MKKVLAIVLAVILVFGMSTVAFAARVVDMGSLGGDLFLYNASKEKMESIGVGSEPVSSGSTLYIPLRTKVDTDDGIKSANISKVSDLGDYKMKLSVTEGKGMVESARFTIQDDFDGRNAAHVAIKTKPNTTGKKVDVEFTLTVTPNNGATLEGIDYAFEYDFYFTIAPAKGETAPSGSNKEETKPESSSAAPAENSNAANAPSNTDAEKNPETGASSFAALTAVAVLACTAVLATKKK